MSELTEKQKIGRLGENLAVKFLENKGFSVIDRNYSKKYGEIDIIAQEGQILHFIEVKCVSREKKLQNRYIPVFPHRSNLWGGENVSRETKKSDTYRPEDNVHEYKLKRLSRTIQAYLLKKYTKSDPEWVFDVITVRVNSKSKKAEIKFIEDLVL